MAKLSKNKNKLAILLILSLILPVFSFAQNHTVEPPANPEEVKEMGEKVLETTKRDLPGILERIWKEEAIPFWQKMWTWVKGCWQDKIWPAIAEFCSSLGQRFTQAIKGFWERRIRPPVEQELEKRKNIVEERIEKEKEEIKAKLIPQANKSLWERFKDLIK